MTRIILSNPPYSVGQKSANDGNPNEKYPRLDARIRESYAARSTATAKVSLYDSYLRAFRMASDLVGEGIVAFITPNGWIMGNAAAGVRKCFADEFSAVYVVNLKGNGYGVNGDLRRREGGKIFDASSGGGGCQCGIAITFLVRSSADTAPIEVKPLASRCIDVAGYTARADATDGRTQDKNGVVYTPIEVVDFMVQSAAALCCKHFGVQMYDPSVEVLDPFAGTGIFIARALSLGLVDPSRQSIRQIEIDPIAANEARKRTGVETINADTFAMYCAGALV